MFIKQSGAKEEETTEMLMKVWKALEGDKRTGVSTETLKVFLGAVIKIMFVDDPTINSSSSPYGAFSLEGKYAINQAAATKIHQDFVLMYLNHKSYSAAATTAKPAEDAEYSFKPSLCEHSVTLASAVREKRGAKDKEQQPTQTNGKSADPVERLTQAKKELEAYADIE